MKMQIIPASGLVYFQRWLRQHGAILIRARPFRDLDGMDCYAMYWVGEA